MIGLLFLFVSKKSKSATEGALIVGGMGLIGFVFAVTSFAVLPTEVLSHFVTGLYSALMVYMMALIALWESDGDRSHIVSSGAFFALYGLASGIASTILPAFLSSLNLYNRMSNGYLAFIGIVAALIISLGVGIVFFALITSQRKSFSETESQTNERESIVPMGETMMPADDLLYEKAVDALATEYRLTKREKQTVSLVARGYTAKRVAEEMVVSQGTIQSYSKSIYRKMGIHRKDELIELVNVAKHNL